MSTQDKYNSSFITDFLPLIAVLAYHEFPIVSIKKDTPRHAYFCFSETGQLKDIANRFWNGQLLVEPKRFFSTLKEIKSRLYEQVPEPKHL